MNVVALGNIGGFLKAISLTVYVIRCADDPSRGIEVSVFFLSFGPVNEENNVKISGVNP